MLRAHELSTSKVREERDTMSLCFAGFPTNALHVGPEIGRQCTPRTGSDDTRRNMRVRSNGIRSVYVTDWLLYVLWDFVLT